MLTGNFVDRLAGKTISSLGRPAVGKDDQNVRLVNRLEQEIPAGVKFLHMSALIKERRDRNDAMSNRIASCQQVMDAGGFLPDDLICELVADFMEQVSSKDVLICNGFPRNREQALKWREIMRGRQHLVMVELLAPREVCLGRIASRPVKRPDDDPAAALNRQKLYEQVLPGLYSALSKIRVPIIKIDARQTRDEVEAAILRDLELFFSLPAYRHHDPHQVFSRTAMAS